MIHCAKFSQQVGLYAKFSQRVGLLCKILTRKEKHELGIRQASELTEDPPSLQKYLLSKTLLLHMSHFEN